MENQKKRGYSVALNQEDIKLLRQRQRRLEPQRGKVSYSALIRELLRQAEAKGVANG